MKIYFSTHATSLANEQHLAAGWDDPGLSQRGRTQALERRETFREMNVDLICCSDLKRSRDTVEIAFGKRYPLIVDARLREINHGDLNGLAVDVVDSMNPVRIKTPFPGGESYEQVAAGVAGFIRELSEKQVYESVLIVGHRATKFGLDTLLLGTSPEECLSRQFTWQSYWAYEIG